MNTKTITLTTATITHALVEPKGYGTRRVTLFTGEGVAMARTSCAAATWRHDYGPCSGTGLHNGRFLATWRVTPSGRVTLDRLVTAE